MSSDQQLANVNPQNSAVPTPPSQPQPGQGNTTETLASAATPPAAGATPPPAGPPPGRYSVLADIVNGAFRGAAAVDEMRAPGVLMWIAIGFIPGIGTLAALRDARYALLIRDWGALFFDVLGIIPFAKGFSNVALASRAHQVHRAVHTAHQMAHVMRHGRAAGAKLGSKGRQLAQASVATGAAHGVGALNIMASEGATLDRNAFAWPALFFSLVTALVAPFAAVMALVASLAITVFPQLSQGYATLIVGGMALLWSLSAVMLARRASHDAKALMGRQYARAMISWLASLLAWLSFLVVLAASAGLLYAELGLFGVR